MSETPKNPWELHSERLSTTDEHGHRVYLYPEDVKGKWKNRRQWVYGFLIFIFMVLPWIHWSGRQIILLDIPKREFVFFGNVFQGHEAPYLIFLLLLFPLTIGLVTLWFGRVWCGWACPQTVFIQALYAKIERWVEGPARRRQKRDQGIKNFNYWSLKAIKWFLFALVSIHLSHSFLGYFVGTHNLLKMSLQGPGDNWTLFVTMLFLSGLFLFDFGWFREQFCVIACPYGRFQSVMMDEDSLVVAYQEKRGEPRRAYGLSHEDEGDCVNCYHCVRVCPTGIDIRRGAGQLECIACTQCIDACDEIMLRVGRPTGLIGYTSERELKGGAKRWINLRSLIYLGIVGALAIGFMVSLNQRQEMGMTFIRGVGVPYQLAREGELVINRYQVKIDSQTDEELSLFLEIEGEEREVIELVVPRQPFQVKQGRNTIGVFFRFPPSLLVEGNHHVKVNLYQQTAEGEKRIKQQAEVNLVGPL